jgi:hypothetical protein
MGLVADEGSLQDYNRVSTWFLCELRKLIALKQEGRADSDREVTKAIERVLNQAKSGFGVTTR